MAQLMSGEAKNQNIPGLDAILRGEILRKDGLIRQLMEQNKMLLATKERQEMEMAAINETLEVRKPSINAGAKIHILSKNSHIENLNFYKVHLSKISFFTKFTFLECQFSQNSHS